MKSMHICFLVCYALALASAQALLKVAVFSVTGARQTFSMHLFVVALLQKWSFWGAMFLWGMLAFIWAWLLTFIPLQQAYPFIVLAIVFVGLFEYFFWGAPLGYKFFLGTFCIAIGLYCLSTQSVN